MELLNWQDFLKFNVSITIDYSNQFSNLSDIRTPPHLGKSGNESCAIWGRIWQDFYFSIAVSSFIKNIA